MGKFCLLICSFLSLLFTNNEGTADLHVRHASGGQATSLVINGNYWYQALGERLLVLRKNGGALVSTVQLASPATAICTDLLIDGNLLYALLDGKEVLVFDIVNPLRPELTSRKTQAELGILPRHFANVRNEPVVLGSGGVVALRDGKKIVSCDCKVTSAAESTTEGIAYVSQQTIVSNTSGKSLGLAAQLLELDASANVDKGTILYVRDLSSETEIGLLAGDLHAIPSPLAKKILEGNRTSVLVRGSRIFVATTSGIYVLGLAPTELRVLRYFALEGVQSIGVVASNYLALSGNFGRGVFRISEDTGGAGETLFRVVPSHGAMAAGVFDVRGVQVPTEMGSVLYRFNEKIEILEDTLEPVKIQTSAIVLGGEAIIDARSGNVTIVTSSTETQLQLTAQATTVIANKGNFWFGTDDGVTVVERTSDGSFVLQESVQLAGPIVQLIPLFDGGVAFVSEAGFVGIVEESQGEVALEQ